MKWILLLLLIPIVFSAEFPKEIKVNYNTSAFCIPVFSNVTETIEIFFRGMQRVEKIEPCKVNYFCYENLAREMGKEYAYINGTKITIDFGYYNRTEYFLNLNAYYCPGNIKELEKLRETSITNKHNQKVEFINEVVMGNETITVKNNQSNEFNITYLLVILSVLIIFGIIYFIKKNLLI